MEKPEEIEELEELDEDVEPGSSAGETAPGGRDPNPEAEGPEAETDERGVPLKNVVAEYKRKLEAEKERRAQLEGAIHEARARRAVPAPEGPAPEDEIALRKAGIVTQRQLTEMLAEIKAERQADEGFRKQLDHLNAVIPDFPRQARAIEAHARGMGYSDQDITALSAREIVLLFRDMRQASQAKEAETALAGKVVDIAGRPRVAQGGGPSSSGRAPGRVTEADIDAMNEDELDALIRKL